MSPFSQIVYELALSIPEGRVVTYGDLAKAAGGGAMASRSISSILSKAPNQRTIPWHRIVYAGGRAWLTPDLESVVLYINVKE
jgi:methylated-DNA-protein-cysteine methyltransferase related protein